MKMGSVHFLETLTPVYQKIRRHTAEDDNLHNHHRKVVESHSKISDLRFYICIFAVSVLYTKFQW
jgi:hypothetical protein